MNVNVNLNEFQSAMTLNALNSISKRFALNGIPNFFSDYQKRLSILLAQIRVNYCIIEKLMIVKSNNMIFYRYFLQVDNKRYGQNND